MFSRMSLTTLKITKVKVMKVNLKKMPVLGILKMEVSKKTSTMRPRIKETTMKRIRK